MTWVRFSRGSTWSDAINRTTTTRHSRRYRPRADPAKRAQLISDWMVLEANSMEAIPLWWCDQTFGYNKKTIESMTPTPGLGDDYNLS